MVKTITKVGPLAPETDSHGSLQIYMQDFPLAIVSQLSCRGLNIKVFVMQLNVF